LGHWCDRMDGFGGLAATCKGGSYPFRTFTGTSGSYTCPRWPRECLRPRVVKRYALGQILRRTLLDPLGKPNAPPPKNIPMSGSRLTLRPACFHTSASRPWERDDVVVHYERHVAVERHEKISWLGERRLRPQRTGPLANAPWASKLHLPSARRGRQPTPLSPRTRIGDHERTETDPERRSLDIAHAAGLRSVPSRWRLLSCRPCSARPSQK
jgi:hypothetical protein